MQQLEGSLKLGPVGGPLVECGAEVFGYQIVEKRVTSTRRPTLADATAKTTAGAYSFDLILWFEDTLNPSTSTAHKQITTAIRSDSGLMSFELIGKTGAVAAANPKYSGNVTVQQVVTGGEVGRELEQQQTFPGATALTVATS